MRLRRTFLTLMLVAIALPGFADQIRPIRGRRPIPGQAPAAQSQASAGPVVLRPEQMPAVPPEITFRDGSLTINAPNSTLGDILRGVRNQTGASVDLPGNATERVMGKFGPGPARDVLSALLNGTHFNYVLMGSATDPDALDRVVLTAKSNGGEAPATQEANAAPPNQGPPPPAPAANAPDDLFGSASDQGDDSTENIFATDDQNNSDDQQAQNTPFGQQPQQPDARTPEQMLQDLQQQQAQQQQAQQQQGFNNGQPGQDQNGQQQNGPQRPFPGRPFRGLPNPNGNNNPSPNPEP